MELNKSARNQKLSCVIAFDPTHYQKLKPFP